MKTPEEVLDEMVTLRLESSESRDRKYARQIGIENFVSAETKAFLGYRELLALQPRRKRRVAKSSEVVYQHAWVDGETATLENVKAIITKALSE